ncbi:NAD(P)/FAD-dependent oxidoreductase, partial [Candidatus Saccharibacteria bacterium]|nr:NAD(P)/FAD-dependent oxidoreductase [Candidatus Saccharibacteria bacterium]
RYGVEIADLMAIFGTKVYIIEEKSRLLPEFEKEVGDYMSAVLGARKEITVLTGSRTLSVSKEGASHRVLFTRGGAQKHVKVDAIMIATDYRPNVDIGLNNALVKYSEDGIPTDKYLRTNVKHIYAAGDVLGKRQDTHAALIESRVAAHNIIGAATMVPDYVAMPKVVFSSPEVAQVGLTEQEARRTHSHVRRAVTPLHIVARSNVSGQKDGFIKLVADKQGVIIGGVVVGPHATEIIHEISLAVRYRLTAQQLATTPHVFLSWAEAMRVTAQKIIGANS